MVGLTMMRPSLMSLFTCVRELALPISDCSEGSSHILRFPTPATLAARRFCDRRFTMSHLHEVRRIFFPAKNGQTHRFQILSVYTSERMRSLLKVTAVEEITRTLDLRKRSMKVLPLWMMILIALRKSSHHCDCIVTGREVPVNWNGTGLFSVVRVSLRCHSNSEFLSQ